VLSEQAAAKPTKRNILKTAVPHTKEKSANQQNKK
jgi:hypothetical protein